MVREQLQLLLALYYRPIHAASRIIDEGRLWFALCAALLTLGGLQAWTFLSVRPLLAGSSSMYSYLEHKAPSHVASQKTPAADQRYDEDADFARSDPYVRFIRPMMALGKGGAIFEVVALLVAWDPKILLKLLGAVALAFVPAAILVMTLYRSHESFPVMLRKDYLSLLNSVLLSLTASYLPAILLSLLLQQLMHTFFPMLLLLALAQLYFLFLVVCCIRTVWGSGFLVATGAMAAGWVATLGGLILFTILGPAGYYLSSPFFLYYAYAFVGSDIRSLGDGFRSRQHLRRQLDIATNNPRDADAHYQLGLIYQQRRQNDEAKKRFERAVEIDPKEADPVFQLGKIAVTENRLDDAIDFLNKAAKLDDKCSAHEVWRELGVAYLQAGRLQDASDALTKYVDRRPYDPEGLYWRGKTLHSLGCLEETRQELQKCKEAVETMPPHRRRQLAKWKRMALAELRGLEKVSTPG